MSYFYLFIQTLAFSPTRPSGRLPPSTILLTFASSLHKFPHLWFSEWPLTAYFPSTKRIPMPFAQISSPFVLQMQVYQAHFLIFWLHINALRIPKQLAQISSPISTNFLTYQHKFPHLKTPVCTNFLTYQHKSSHLTPRIFLILSHFLTPKHIKRCSFKRTKQQQGRLRRPRRGCCFSWICLWILVRGQPCGLSPEACLRGVLDVFSFAGQKEKHPLGQGVA